MSLSLRLLRLGVDQFGESQGSGRRHEGRRQQMAGVDAKIDEGRQHSTCSIIHKIQSTSKTNL